MYVNSKFFNCESTWFLLWVVEQVVYYCGWLSSLQKKKTFGKSLLQAFGYTCLRCVFKNCTILVCNVQNALICHCEMFCVVYQILKFLVQNASIAILFLVHINRNRMYFIDCFGTIAFALLEGTTTLPKWLYALCELSLEGTYVMKGSFIWSKYGHNCIWPLFLIFFRYILFVG